MWEGRKPRQRGVSVEARRCRGFRPSHSDPVRQALSPAAAWCGCLALLAANEPRVHFDSIVVDGHVDVPMNILALGLDPADPGDREGCFPVGFPDLRDAERPGAPWCTHFDFARAKAGGMDAAFFAIYIDSAYVGRLPKDGGGAGRRTFDMIAATHAAIAKHPDLAVMATTADDV